MAEIMPFRGLLYNSEKVGDLKLVMAPPYDVISPRMQDELYSRHPDNIVRIILAKASADDRPGSDRYSRAAADLKKRTEDGTFIRDELPSIYYYTQTYKLKDGASQTRKGFVALSRIEEFGKGKIHAHEQTLSGPKADRLRLMQACNANLSCIFSLYSEPELSVNRRLEDAVRGTRPVIDVLDDDGIENRLWRIDDPEVIRKVTEGMRNKALFIADGHHRYETALNYRNLMREKTGSSTGLEPYNYVMMYFSNMDDEGMTIWPTHRIVHGVKGFNPDTFLGEVGKYFNMESLDYTPANEASVRTAFLRKIRSEGKRTTAIGVSIRAKSVYYVLTLKSEHIMDKAFGTSIPEVFKNLDVTVLHSLILSKVLGITKEAQEMQENLIYVKSAEEALSAFRKEPNQIAFLLNPTRIEQVKAVAEAGFVMPQKSTYFFPKLLSGLVINLLNHRSLASTPAKI